MTAVKQGTGLKCIHETACPRCTPEFMRLRDEIKRLRAEVALLRSYGNKDCTSMADVELEKLGIKPSHNWTDPRSPNAGQEKSDGT